MKHYAFPPIIGAAIISLVAVDVVIGGNVIEGIKSQESPQDPYISAI